MDKKKLEKIIYYTQNLRLLYIEDNINVRNQTLKMLKIFFDTIDVANNGEEGLFLFKKNNISSSFDLIITDLEMPIIDGISMINTIRSIDKQIPILIFSAHSNTDYFLQTISIGIDGYVLKPYDIETISNALMNIIEKNRLSNNEDDIVHLEYDYIWKIKESLLYKDNKVVKLTKNEIKLFTFFINSKGTLKTYDTIESFIFTDFNSNNKRIRNLVSRLKTKLDCELFESIYSHGYKLKYKKFI